MTTNHRLSGLAHVLVAAVLSILAALLVYILAVHPWQVRYGATDGNSVRKASWSERRSRQASRVGSRASE